MYKEDKYEGEYAKVFKSTFDYLKNGKLNKKEWAELSLLICNLMWYEDELDETNISDRVSLVWDSLKHTIAKSKKNAKAYRDKKAVEDIQQPTSKSIKPNYGFVKEEKEPSCFTDNTMSESLSTNKEKLKDMLFNSGYTKNQNFTVLCYNNPKVMDSLHNLGLTKEEGEEVWNEVRK